MCQLVFFSTTSDEDFTKIASEHFQICEPTASDEPYLELLAYPHRWYLMSRYGGCSCYYRHEINGRGSSGSNSLDILGGCAKDPTYAPYDALLKVV